MRQDVLCKCDRSNCKAAVQDQLGYEGHGTGSTNEPSPPSPGLALLSAQSLPGGGNLQASFDLHRFSTLLKMVPSAFRRCQALDSDVNHIQPSQCQFVAVETLAKLLLQTGSLMDRLPLY